MLSLSGELTLTIKTGLQKSAQRALQSKEVKKAVLDAEELLLKNIDESGELKRNDRVIDAEETLKVKDHLNGGFDVKNLSIANNGLSKGFSVIRPYVKQQWISYLAKKGVKFEIGTENAIKVLKENNALGLHETRWLDWEINQFEQTIYLYKDPSTAVFLEECYHAVQRLQGLPQYMKPITYNGIKYENFDAWEYLAKKRVLDGAERNGITYEEYIFIENQLLDVLEGYY